MSTGLVPIGRCLRMVMGTGECIAGHLLQRCDFVSCGSAVQFSLPRHHTRIGDKKEEKKHRCNEQQE